MGLTVQPPSIQAGQYAFSVDDEGQIRYGLGAIKGLGEGPISNLLSAERGRAVYQSVRSLRAHGPP